ncbi:hypothetical protein Tco_0815229 [Tanacetum coccineum]
MVVLVVVDAIIGVVVVVSGVPSIIKLSFVIIGSLHRIVLCYLIHQPLSYGNGLPPKFEALRRYISFKYFLGNPPMKTSMNFSVFGTMFGHKTANSWNLLTPDDLVGMFYSNRWYQSHVALDLGSTRFWRKVEVRVEGCKLSLVLLSIDVNTTRYVFVLPMAVTTASLIFEDGS